MIGGNLTAVVGVGASAGGLEALRELFGVCEDSTNLAFVVVQHLDPTHASLMAQLIERYTTLPVTQVGGGETIEADHVYVIPPGRGLVVRDGRLELVEFKESRGMRRPIDDFFESLSDAFGDRAAGVVLSGTGGDGSRGLRAIKEHGGLCVAQEPESARYDGMPLSAIATGQVDFVAPPNQIIPQICGYFDRLEQGVSLREESSEIGDHVDDLCEHLRNAVGHDFSLYKRATLIRRVARRMHVLGLEDPAAYVERVKRDGGECELLFRDLLINVTRFFRDSEQFDSVRQMGIETIVRQSPEQAEVRVWVPGCSSGEEAYTIAMLFADAMDRAGVRLFVQIFGTDIDDRMIEIARKATYPLSVLEDIPEDFRDRFCIVGPTSFQLSHRIRDMVRFSNHDLVRDPPFAKMNLVSCRNLLIYFSDQLQALVLPLFHFSLVERGWLFLGSSETIGRHEDLFEVLDQRARVYQRKSVKGRYHLQIGGYSPPVARPPRRETVRDNHTLENQALRRIADSYAPVSLLVDAEGLLLDRWGAAGKFLDFPDKLARSVHIPSLARPGLREIISPLLRQVQSSGRRMLAKAIPVLTEFGKIDVSVACEPVDDGAMLLVLREEGPLQPLGNSEAFAAFDEFDLGDGGTRFLEEELQSTRHRLRTTVEELETTNEELKSSNEEMMSMNEELQSTNEELVTVNDELKVKVDQLLVANSDLKNFFDSTESIVIVVDENLRLRSFSDAAVRLFRIDRHLIGRNLGDVASDLADEEHLRFARQAAEKGTFSEYRTGTRDGQRDFVTRILPYRRLDGTIEGATLVFTDVTQAMTLERDLGVERERLRLALQIAKIGVWEYEPSTDRVRLDETEKQLLDLEANEADSMEPILARLTPEDRDRVNGALRRAIDGEHEFNEIFRLPLRGGGTRWLHGMGRRMGEAETRQFVGVTFDITPERELLETRELMIREMNHRVKNLFAVISALVALSSREASDAQDLANGLRARIHALGRSHALTSDQPIHSTVGLADLVDTVVRPTLGSQAFSAEGPDVEISRAQLTSLSLVLHEWATNSAKYGALSVPDGRLDVRWTREGGDILLSWTEVGASEAGEEKPGFGTRLIAATAQQLGGDVRGERTGAGYARSLRFGDHLATSAQ